MYYEICTMLLLYYYIFLFENQYQLCMIDIYKYCDNKYCGILSCGWELMEREMRATQITQSYVIIIMTIK